MEDQNNKKVEELIINYSYLNKPNQVDKKLLENLMPNIKKISFKNGESEKSSSNNNPKVTGKKQIQACPSSASYKTETLYSYNTQNKPNFNIFDNISEQSDSKKLPLSRDKKIYMCLKNNNKNIDTNIIFQNNNSLLKKKDYFFNKEIPNKIISKKNYETIEDPLNKTNIINNNNVNNIFVNIISTNAEKDYSRNIGREKLNNCSTISSNNIFDAALNKTTISKVKKSKNSKNTDLRDCLSQPKINKENFSIKEQKNRVENNIGKFKIIYF